MPSFRTTTLLAFLLFPLSLLQGQSSDPRLVQTAPSASSSSQSGDSAAEGSSAQAIPLNAPRISKHSRYEVIREFETQLVYARTAFPMGKKGLLLKQGVITPNGEELQQALNLWGPAVKPGDPAHISFVQIKDDHIHFEINGGPIHREKWYQRVQISGS